MNPFFLKCLKVTISRHFFANFINNFSNLVELSAMTGGWLTVSLTCLVT
jgi:hypothetical protein